MASYREFPRRGWALFTRIAYLGSAAITAGSVIGFLFLVFMGIVGEEVLLDLWTSGNWDPVFRAGVGATGITIALGAGLVVTFLGLSRYTYANQLARLSSPEVELTVPLPRELDGFQGPHPFSPLFIFSIFFLIIDGFILIILALALGETFRYNPESAGEGFTVFLILAGLGVVVVVLCVVANLIGKPQWIVATALITSRWQAARPLAESRLKAGIPRFALAIRKKRSVAARALRASAVSLAIAGVIFMIGVFIRKPGRRADLRYYDEPGEAFIDFLIGVSAVATAIALTVLLAALLGAWGAQIAELSRLRSIADGRMVPVSRAGYRNLTGKAAVVRLHDVFARPWPGQLVGAVLVGLGWGNAPFFVVTQQVVPGTWPDWMLTVLLVIGAIGVVVLVWSDGAAARSRNRLLLAWGKKD